MEFVRADPALAALIGAGLGVLGMAARSQRSEERAFAAVGRRTRLWRCEEEGDASIAYVARSSTPPNQVIRPSWKMDRTTKAVPATAISSSGLWNTRFIGWPIRLETMTSTGATSSATWMLEPTAMPPSSPMRTRRANEMAAKVLGRVADHGEEHDTQEELREPEAARGRLQRAGDQLGFHREDGRRGDQNADSYPERPLRFFLRLLTSEHIAVRHQRVDQVPEIGQDQDSGDPEASRSSRIWAAAGASRSRSE